MPKDKPKLFCGHCGKVVTYYARVCQVLKYKHDKFVHPGMQSFWTEVRILNYLIVMCCAILMLTIIVSLPVVSYNNTRINGSEITQGLLFCI